MENIRTFLLFAALIINFSSPVSAQIYGKLYLQEEAEVTYGPVMSYVSIKTADLQQALDKAGNFIMFNFSEDGLIILSEGRKVLFPTGISVDADTIFKTFSVSMVRELLLKGQEETTKVENRKNVISLTNGTYTLEFSVDCPPFCN